MYESWNQIKTIASLNHNIITTRQVEESGLSRTVLKKYVDDGQLQRISKGLYTLADCISDEYLLIQLRCDNLLFSYGTALYFWGFSDRTPHTIDVTVLQGTNVSKLKRDNPQLHFHYVQKAMYDIGITETQSPQGGTIRLYDKERCICDLIRDKRDIDLQLYTQAIKDYFRSGSNSRKLLKYGKEFGLEEKIRTYMEVLT